MDFVCKLYGNTYAVYVTKDVTVGLVGVATLNLALPAPLVNSRLCLLPSVFDVRYENEILQRGGFMLPVYS